MRNKDKKIVKISLAKYEQLIDEEIKMERQRKIEELEKIFKEKETKWNTIQNFQRER